MSLMPEYDATAGFPGPHIEAFKRVAARTKVVVSSRELNPLCTDLVLESYAAKGFHIKAKTCDWGPMAGFVLEDSRFTKGSQDQGKQRAEIENSFKPETHKAGCVPVFISDARLAKLQERKIISVSPGGAANRLAVTAAPTGGANFAFVLAKTASPPSGCEAPMWGVYYDRSVTPERSNGRSPLRVDVPAEPGLEPVTGMVNPDDAKAGKLGVKSAVAGDYDLWCLFPHETAKDMGFGTRGMDLRATLPKSAAPLLHQQAAQAGLVFGAGEKNALAKQKEDAHLGNISLGLMKIRTELNREVAGTGYKAGNVVQHSDYGGNPFGDIDYPLIFFIPKPPSGGVDVAVARNIAQLKEVLKTASKLGFRIKLNPAWTVPSF